MANVQISQLPAALPLDGSELVPVVQGGVTVRTTTQAIAASPNLTQTFLTVNNEPTLPNSRYLTASPGISITDGGAQSLLNIALTGAAASLNTAATGLIAKTGASTVAARSFIASGTGLSVSNGDGVAGNPTISLVGQILNFAQAAANGLVTLTSGGAVSATYIQGTSGQISVANGDGIAGPPTLDLVATGVIAGTYGSASGVPVVTVDNRGRISSISVAPAVTGGTVTEIDTGYGLLGGPITVAGTISVDTSVIATLSGIQTLTNKTISGSSNTLTSIGNSSLVNSQVTINGSTVSLGGSITITASVSNPLTIGTGLSGGSYDGSTAVTISIDSTVVTLTGSQTLTNKSISGASNTLTNINNSSLVNSSITIGSTTVNLGDTLTTLNGVSISGTSNTLTNIGNSSLTNSSITINGNTVSLGGSTTVTATASNPLTIGTGLTGTSYNGSTPVTIAIDSSVVTLTGTQTLTNKTLTSPLINNTIKLTGAGAGSYTPFAQTFSSAVSNYNGYQLNYIQNTNNGSDASVDYVAYNDASDVDSYFIDMGISSSNYSSPTYTVFPANGGYVYTGGGTSGQASALLLGTSNAASDLIMFTGGTLLANIRATVKGDTGNFLIGTSTDTGYLLNVAGTTYFGGASTFGSTVLLNANPTLALQAATKQYVDAAVSTGFTVHPAVVYATAAALPANTYNNGAFGVGATLTATTNGALSVDGNAVTASQRILVKNEVAQANNGAYVVTQAGSAILPYILTRATDFDQAAAGEIANNAYFFVTAGTTNAGSSFILSQTAAITVGTTALPFALFNDQLDYVGGTNINITGLTISLTGTVAATNGGTGTSTVTTGDLLYGSASNTWSKLPLGVAYKSLIVNASGTQIEWNAIPLNQSAAVSGQLGVSNGGTSFSSYSIGDMVYASGSTTLSKLTLGTSGYVLTAGASAPQYVAQSTLSVGSATTATNVAGGTTGALPYQTGAGATSFLSLGTSGYVLTAGASAPQYVAQSTLSVGSATNATNTAITASSTSADYYITVVSANTGNLPQLVATGLTANPSTGKITGGISGGTF
jgi:hypothetical protein